MTSISCQAFEGCESLRSVHIPEGLTGISSQVFSGCSALESVTIPDSVKFIGEYAFVGCNALKSIVIPENVNKICYDAFMKCDSLESVTILNPDCTIFDEDATISNGYDSETQTFYYQGTIIGAEGSTAQAYAEKYSYNFKNMAAPVTTEPEPEPQPQTPTIGDINGDGKIDASDASMLLVALAAYGAGQSTGLTSAQIARVDADGNGRRNAADATVILQYAAYQGAGGKGTLSEFIVDPNV